jgi:hypothetical protein
VALSMIVEQIHCMWFKVDMLIEPLIDLCQVGKFNSWINANISKIPLIYRK